MKKLRTFAHQSEAFLAKALLGSHGIAAEVTGAKEYASHVLGGDTGHYTLLVGADDLPEAKRLIDEVMAKDMVLTTESSANYFRKAVFFAIGAVILIPVVFNVVSLINAHRFWKSSDQDTTAMVKVAIILLLQIPTIIALQVMYGMVSELSSILVFPE